MAVGTLTLHRFNGDEVFAISNATIKYFAGDEGVTLEFDVRTDPKPLKTLPDTSTLRACPNGVWQTLVPSFDVDDVSGVVYTISHGYDEDLEVYVTNFYYVEHDTIDDNEITIFGREGSGVRAGIVGKITDVNFFDGSMPKTKVVVDAVFNVSKSAEPIEPVG